MHEALKDIPFPDSRELYRLVTEHTARYDEVTLSERAAKDAEQNLPSPESEEPAPFEKQLLNEFSKLASKIVSKYKVALEMLDAKIKAEQDSLERKQEHFNKNIGEYSRLEQDGIENAHILKDAHRQYEQAEQRYNDFYAKHARPPVVYIPQWLYVIFALAIFLGEIPLNALVFQIFGENQVMTWIMAGIIGLCVPLGAHFIGIKFRERPDGKSFYNVTVGLLATAVIVFALYGLSEMRTSYLDVYKEELGLTPALVKSSFQFFGLNVAVLGAAIMISYLSHDSVPGFHEAKVTLEKARKRLSKLEKDRLAQLKDSRLRKLKLEENSDEDYRTARNRVILLQGHYDKTLKEGQELEAQCLTGMRHDVELYRRENLRFRTDKQTPASFRIDLTFPMKLHELKEKLNNEE